MSKPSGSIRGRVALSQRAWTLPDGRPLSWWSLAPTSNPSGERAARTAASEIPAEHRETAWLVDDDGAVWWALLDVREDRVAYASLRDLPTEAPATVAAHAAPAPEPVASAPPPADDAAPEPAPEPERTTMPTTTADHGRTIVSTLRGFDVAATVESVTHGATVDRYSLKPGPGVRVAQVVRLADDLALALDAPSVRVLPAGGHVAVEVPATVRRTVPLADLADHLEHDHPLRVPVGVAVDGAGISARLDRLPHLLVAGTTGSGKSTWTSAVLAHLVTHAEPADVRLALIDPKRVELAPFGRVPHLWRPVATDVEAAVDVLEDALDEMESRYAHLEAAGRRGIDELGEDRPPYLVVVVDELADLMMQAGKRAEAAVVRLLQVGRAAGVHLILATQRPSADVVTGLIKANTPSRLVFAVQSHTDSGVALGQSGAETLLGAGDALWWPSGASRPERVQVPYLSTEELDEILAPLEREAPRGAPGDVVGVRAGMLARLRDGAHAEQDRETVALEVPPEPAVLADPPTIEAMVPLEPPRRATPHADLERHEAEIERVMHLAYARGRRHAEIERGDARLATHRIMLPTDWAIAVLVFVLVTVGGVVALPVLPVAAGVVAARAVTRHRTSMDRHAGRAVHGRIERMPL